MKSLNFKELVTIGIGIIIGSGVITLTGFGIGYTDTGISIAYVLAGLLFLFSMLPTLIVGVTVPRTSFSYTVSKELISPIAGGMFLVLFFIGRIILSFFGVSFGNYLASIVPGVNPNLAGILVITFFYIVNLFGVESATKIQKIFNIILILALSSFAFLGLIKLQPDALTAERLFPNGMSGIISAVALVMFSMGGGLVLLEFGGMVEKPQKTLLKAILTVTGVATFLFAMVGLAGSGVLPYEAVANKPLTFAAQTIYGNKTGVMLFVIGGALVAIVTTINASLMWYCNTMIKGIEDGWFPKILATKNKNGAPYYLLTIFYIIGVLPIILGANIGFLATIGTGLALLFFLIPNFSLINLPQKYPEEWKNSIFYTPNNFKLKLLTFTTSGVFTGLIIYNFLKYNKTVLLSIGGVILLGAIYILARYRRIENELR